MPFAGAVPVYRIQRNQLAPSSSSEIPVQSKMMTIADIFDALTDKDRPYKKAVPLERALDILKMEVKDHHVDGDLLNIFIESKVFEKLNTHKQIG